eukprot:CFRG4616T1
MKSLGAFSNSLAVKDLKASKDFYEKLGFKVAGGEEAQDFLIMRNADNHTIGLFHGMFRGNIMTFNPGWDSQANRIDGEFTDVRVLQKQLKDQGVQLVTEADETTMGPASFMLSDPDGNTILIDQHV